MANLSLSTQIPQIGDSSQQLLARMAAAAALGRFNDAPITVLSSGVRSSSSYIAVTTPPGVIGFILRLSITAVPGVDTVNLMWLDGSGQYIPMTSIASASAGQHMIILRNQYADSANPAYVYSSKQTSGITDSTNVAVIHSGAGNFTYSLTLRWLRS